VPAAVKRPAVNFLSRRRKQVYSYVNYMLCIRLNIPLLKMLKTLLKVFKTHVKFCNLFIISS